LTIQELVAVVPPPTTPLDTDVGNWAKAEELVGFSLPSDYRDFAVLYGSGNFCDGFLNVVNPLSVVKFQQAIDYLIEVLHEVSRRRNDPYSAYPENPGLLPWGADENGNSLHWLTEGDANSWPVVIESHEGDFERYDITMTTFLALALTNNIRPTYIWGQPFRNDERTFHPLA